MLQKAHRLAVTWLKNAQEIMVWGLALHPYDAELLTVIQGTQGPEKTHRLTQVTIINPNESDRDRAGLFLGAPPTLRTDINPSL